MVAFEVGDLCLRGRTRSHQTTPLVTRIVLVCITEPSRENWIGTKLRIMRLYESDCYVECIDWWAVALWRRWLFLQVTLSFQTHVKTTLSMLMYHGANGVHITSCSLVFENISSHFRAVTQSLLLHQSLHTF